MKAVIAIGANLGNPQENIDLAVALLKEATDLTALSSMYVTKPVGGPAQPDYINAVALAESDLPAADFLSMLHGIEAALGRERKEHWGPRTIDLDLIQYGSILSHSNLNQSRLVYWVLYGKSWMYLAAGTLKERKIEALT